MGIDCHGFNLWVSISPVSEAWIDETFKAYGIMPGEKLIAVHPGASCISKRWPPERFGEVADKLAQKYHAKILLIGSADDQLIAKEVLMSMKQPVVDMTGKTTVSHLISLLKRCTLLVSNDSGPVHLAVGVKTPVISIFGRNQAGLAPTRWKPLGFLDVALHRDVGCKVCLAHLCELDFKCLKSISVDHVLEAAEAIFNKSTVLP
jgi:heptosyltransferase-2